MNKENITVFYKWKANPGKLNELKTIYAQVCKDMETNEPGALLMNSYVNEEQEEIIVNDLFQNVEALGFHLKVTAAAHFPQLLQIATPGPFYFCGEVPEEMKQAALSMGLQAEFGSPEEGFNRN